VATQFVSRIGETTSAPDVAFFVEDLPEFVDTEADAALIELAKACRIHGIPLVAEGEVSGWSGSWGLVGELKAAKTGFLLAPDQGDGEAVLRVTLPRSKRADFPPGRGYWVRAGRAEKVQLPLPH